MIFDKEKNQKERNWFIDYWADYMKKVPDKVWAKQQALIIDSVLEKRKDEKLQNVLKERMTGK